ncbi:MAG TPA: FtsX-like permease family protein [Oligoflexales bacterium]|nr:FtsX-like permease family protein [Oligoflexales bacterium]
MSKPFVTGARRFLHALGEGFKGLFVAPGQTLACILSLAIAGSLLVLSLSFADLAVSMLDRTTRNTEVLVYLKEQVTSKEIMVLMDRIKGRPDVLAVKYLTADQDRALNEELLPQDIVASMPQGSIPGQHALNIAFDSGTVDLQVIEDLSKFLKTLEEVDIVAEPPVGAARVQALATVIQYGQVIAAILAALLLGGILFFVVGTLARTMDSRLEEMAILKLLGATDLHLKAPLYIQGIVQGLLGLIAGAVVAKVIIAATNGYIVATLGLMRPIPFNQPLVFTLAAIGGVLVGILAASIASLRRLP